MEADKESLKKSLSDLSKRVDKLNPKTDNVTFLRHMSESYHDQFFMLLQKAKQLYPTDSRIMAIQPQLFGLFEADIEPNIREMQLGIEQLQEAVNANEKSSKKKWPFGRDPATTGSPASIFEFLDFHPIIKNVSFKLFADGHYPQSIFEAYKALNNYVKEKSGSTNLDGRALMSEVFSHKKPILQLNPLQNESDRDEQEGFMLLYMGAIVGIRNPKGHEIVRQADPKRTLEYLALASLLARRVDEAKRIDQPKIESTQSKANKTTAKTIVVAKVESPVFSNEQLAYRARLKEELITMRISLDNVVNPSEITFPVWLTDPNQRRKLVGSNEDHDLVQKFYTALQDRYNYQKP